MSWAHAFTNIECMSKWNAEDLFIIHFDFYGRSNSFRLTWRTPFSLCHSQKSFSRRQRKNKISFNISTFSPAHEWIHNSKNVFAFFAVRCRVHFHCHSRRSVDKRRKEKNRNKRKKRSSTVNRDRKPNGEIFVRIHGLPFAHAQLLAFISFYESIFYCCWFNFRGFIAFFMNIEMKFPEKNVTKVQ